MSLAGLNIPGVMNEYTTHLKITRDVERKGFQNKTRLEEESVPVEKIAGNLTNIIREILTHKRQ